jgi:hypothetical protein
MKKITASIIFGAIITATIISSLHSCKCSHQESKVVNDSTAIAKKDSFPYPGIIFLLPSPSEVLFTTLNNDIAYNQNLIAPNNLDEKAVISHQQALLLGVYLTDLSYSVIFKNIPAGTNDISTIRRLTEKLGIGGLFYDRFLHRIEKNINSIDSMDVLFNDFSQNAFSTIENMGNNELLSLVAMGSGVEAMYLSYKSATINDINTSILPPFVGQKVIYENYYKNFVNYNFNKPELEFFLKDIENIYKLFQRNVVIQNISSVEKVKEANFNIKDKQQKMLHSEKGIRELGDSIVIVRNNLVNLKYQ